MDPDLSALDAELADCDADGYLLDADGDDPDQRYLSGFVAPDPFVTLYNGDTHLLVSALEYGRAKTESRAATVSRHADYADDAGGREAGTEMLGRFLDDHDVDSLLVPERFPVGTADGLREQGIDVTAEDDGILVDIRAVKTDEEIENVRDAQQVNERAMVAAENAIQGADVEDGRLVADGEPLTSERVKTTVETTLLQHGYTSGETIVAGGADAADPHNDGSGPLAAGEPIIVDIFPKSSSTGYHADMTRTFVKGEPSERAEEWYDLSKEALDAALDVVEPGTTGEEVHDAVCDVYEDAGEPTLRDDPETETGFIHGTGHGVGLAVHELPSLSFEGGELEAGNVITIEPGLYDPEVGGVRVEDFVLVTDDGYENLTDYPKRLRVE
ncbi:M24 family metallopeptidase [Halococcus qingdaonensis]|uniref:M24 family metallopeptidase n=1 Tax=Halococcus qingdaonensis TaxID=224402 RepID=UPI002115F6F3|nr:Xaa-Pro peptidase family protein [Halococcus qingdaonensis]